MSTVPKESVIHLWYAELDWSPERLEQGWRVLTLSEQERAMRFVQVKHRERYIAASAILRDILSQYTNIPPAALQFRKGEHGKPYLDHPTDLQFNASHSEGVALFAITRGREVGVDVEFMRRGVDERGVVERFFSPREKAEYLALPPSQQLSAFYRLWTRKEAYIKMIGKGLSFPLKRFSVGLSSANTNQLLEVDDSRGQALKWVVLPISIPVKNYRAAVALEGLIEAVHYFHWDPKKSRLFS